MNNKQVSAGWALGTSITALNAYRAANTSVCCQQVSGAYVSGLCFACRDIQNRGIPEQTFD